MSDVVLTESMQEPRITRTRPVWLSFGLLVPFAFVVVLGVAVWAPQWLSACDPEAVDPNAILLPPDGQHWFGTDELGRDLFSRVVYGTSQSLTIGIGATLIASLGGIVLGTMAALAPRPIGRLLLRIIDILLAFPEMLLALLVIAVLGRGPANTLLAVGLASIAGYARLIRSQVLQIRLSGYVEHAIALGEHPWTIIARHIVPNAIRPLLILATVGVGSSVLSASALSFLGLGVVPPAAEWGALLANGRNFLDIAPWTSLLPATVVALSVISITLLGRRLQTLLATGDLR
ncbi:ABC transporter permease [Rhizobium hainanense]|uniref:Peptide/nickel transport system permease protein n=1 Tax=Rhizobium hainanense TaxID=52131 RepID=A0A1C3VBD1_9HYPH|nr:ABC transporter permease [Rhizobium hainanense]SCB24917.1 peptide/nickel transport system permease protein [Rhizobium hainanense]